MVRVNWSDRATRSLAEIAEYYQIIDRGLAERTVRGILSRANVLMNFPELGPRMPEHERSNIRQLLYGHYRIVYELRSGEVYILDVRHTSRDVSTEDFE